MGCCHFYAPAEGGDNAFSVDPTSISFGRGVIAELGEEARRAGLRHCALITDPRVRSLAPFKTALKALEGAGITWEIYDEISVEPTRGSFEKAAQFAAELEPDGFISIGGGSVMDTTKAANLYSTYPAPLRTYVNAPVGDAQPIPGPLKPHIACPTTSGTGSECTGIAIFDDLELGAKTGIASRQLRPTRALIDPDWTDSLPKVVLACSAFDVLSHALESYTARPYTRRPATPGAERPLSQGANPWSDMGCAEALRILGRHMVAAVNDPDDREARAQVMWAATLAGIAFGNCGVHLPHGMSYSVATCAGDFTPEGYPLDHPVVPHGMSVVINAPAVFSLTGPTSPERHLAAARWLGEAVSEADANEAGIALAGRLRELMKLTDMPIGLSKLGYQETDIERLTDGAIVQQRLLANAPVAVDRELLSQLFATAMTA